MRANTLLISVGGSPEPIIFSIMKIRPENVVFFASKSTRASIMKTILPALGDEAKRPPYEVVLTDDEQDIETCVFALMKKVPAALKKLGVQETDWPSLVDCTGGTKVMSSAVVWASSLFPCEIIYIGTQETRSKGGVGIVKTGRENIIQKKNPWNSVGYLEARSALEAFNRGQYGVAKDALLKLSEKITDFETRQLFDCLACVFGGYHCWDIFDHKQARQILRKWLDKLQLIADESLADKRQFVIPGLKAFVDTAREQLAQLDEFAVPENRKRFLARDLLANARRRGELEQKYEDAVARCYSAIEKTAQAELMEKYGIDTDNVSRMQIPEAIREDFCRRKGPFGLRPAMELLLLLERVRGSKSVGHRFSNLVEKSNLGKLLDERNRSILAHGVTPINSDKYIKLLESALCLMNIPESELISFPKFPI
jgi:CRISPR-associated protein (TIGR02710 family)